MQLHDKVVLVTGAGRGIGRALCREARRRGAAGIDAVVVHDVILEPARASLGKHQHGLGDPVIDHVAANGNLAPAVQRDAARKQAWIGVQVLRQLPDTIAGDQQA